MSNGFVASPVNVLIERIAETPRPRVALALAAGILMVALGIILSGTVWSLIGLSIGSAVFGLAALALVAGWAATRAKATRRDLLTRILGDSADPCFLLTEAGAQAIWKNRAATELLRADDCPDLPSLLQDISADPVGFIEDLTSKAQAIGRASHRVPVEGQGWQFEVTPVGPDTCLWRICIAQRADIRDVLPFEIALADDSGKVTYLSPSLRSLWRKPPSRLMALVDDIRLDTGSVTRQAVGETGQMRLITGFQAPDGQRGLLFLPTATSFAQSPEPMQPHVEIRKLPVAICYIDDTGVISFANDEARRLLHLHTREHPSISDLLEGLGRPVDEWLADMRAGRLAEATEILRLTRAGEESYLKVSLTGPAHNPSGQILAVISDVTEYKSLEAKFTQSQKMQAIGQLAGGVAHDFNNLLTAISGHCDLILLRHDRSDVDYPDLMQIQQNTNRAAALVRQLLALSRQQKLKLETFDVHESVAEVTHLLNRLVGEKITLSLSLGENVRPIRSDKRQFEQVLMNLVINARDAMAMGGEVSIETEAVSLTKSLSRDRATVPAGEYTIVRVRDQGHGIPENLRDKVFDPFFTTKRLGEGTGLGLSTVYGIIKQSGGFIFIDSQEGVGTTMTIYFAAQTLAARARAVAEPAPKPILPSQGQTILLVEDEAPVRSFAARALQLKGHKVLEADCAEAALEMLKDPTIRPDLFVTDVIMPGLDGPTWVAQVREEFPDTPVIFMSGYAEDSRIAAQSRIQNAVFLGKPFSLAQLSTTVAEQLQVKNVAA